MKRSWREGLGEVGDLVDRERGEEGDELAMRDSSDPCPEGQAAEEVLTAEAS